MIPRADAIANIAAVTALTNVMLTGEVSWWPLALRDRLHQPYRLALVPGAERVFAAASAAGAWGTVISGAGPTLMAFTPARCAREVGKAMHMAWAAMGVTAQIHVFEHLGEGAGPFSE
jgi:homoserine kinase